MSAIRARWTSSAAWIAIAAILIASLLAGRIALIGVNFPFDYNEGWNAVHATLAFGAGPLYPPPGGMIGNNYPPLSFYVIGGLGQIIGDPIVAGRIIALASMLVVAAGIFIAVRRFDRAGCTAAAAGTLLFLAFNATLFRSYVAMNDPQWLGHVPMMAGLLCLLQREPGQAPSDRCVVLAAVLMVVGALVKHNLVALPLTATIWLALRHRRALIIWVAVGIVTALLAVIACYAIFGPEMFFDIFQVPREYSAMRMVTKGGVVLLALLPLTIVAARLWRARISDSRIDLFLIGSAIGLLLGIVQRSGFGVDRNAHFEGLTMLCVAAGIFFAAHGFAHSRRWLALILLPLLVLSPAAVRADIRDFADRARNERQWAKLVQHIAAVPGRVACEMPTACFRAGKAYELDFFMYGEYVLIHDEYDVLEKAIAEHRFAAVQLEPGSAPGKGSPSRKFLGGIFNRYYRTIYVTPDGRRLLVPREEKGPS